jgi:hypothetical protein
VHGLVHAHAFDCPDGDVTGGAGAPLAITYPADGARFLLDPERAPAQQRPPFRAIPARSPVRWTVDGVAADRFVPSPGAHLVKASLGGLEREITISFE